VYVDRTIQHILCSDYILCKQDCKGGTRIICILIGLAILELVDSEAKKYL